MKNVCGSDRTMLNVVTTTKVTVCPEVGLGVWKLQSCAWECKSSVIVCEAGLWYFALWWKCKMKCELHMSQQLMYEDSENLSLG